MPFGFLVNLPLIKQKLKGQFSWSCGLDVIFNVILVVKKLLVTYLWRISLAIEVQIVNIEIKRLISWLMWLDVIFNLWWTPLAVEVQIINFVTRWSQYACESHNNCLDEYLSSSNLSSLCFLACRQPRIKYFILSNWGFNYGTSSALAHMLNEYLSGINDPKVHVW